MKFPVLKFVVPAFLIVIASPESVTGQTANVWRGKNSAVVITYDDAIDQHLDNAIPVLDSLGIKATFYLTAYSSSMRNRLNEWRNLSQRGHELGNHTLFHPCIGALPGREWVKGDQDMSKYSLQRLENEIRMTNLFLESLDGKKPRTFAFTCGDMKVGEVAFMNNMKSDFVAARAVRNEMHTIDKIDLYNVDCFMVNHHTADQMIDWVKKAEASHSLLVILFHGVGGGNGLDVAIPEHRKFLRYLKSKEKDIWITTMVEAAEHIAKWQSTAGDKKQK